MFDWLETIVKDDKQLADDDGVFELPEQLITWLNEMGYSTEEIWESF